MEPTGPVEGYKLWVRFRARASGESWVAVADVLVGSAAVFLKIRCRATVKMVRQRGDDRQ